MGGEPTDAERLRLLEALLFACAEPLPEPALASRLDPDADIPALLARLERDYADRGVNLVRVAGGWAFRTALDLAPALRVEETVTRKLSRAAIETLAIIAYQEADGKPVTRGEIEQIRGVATNKGTLDILAENGWITPLGRRETPGRPVIWGTTDHFLDHFGLESLDGLPSLENMRRDGLLDSRPVLYGMGAAAHDLPLAAEGLEDGADDAEE